MATNNNLGFLLFMEPQKPCTGPIIDQYTKKITGAFNQAIAMGGSNYSDGVNAEFAEGVVTRGWHTCFCGAHSSNADYLLKINSEESSVMVHENPRDFFNSKECNKTAGRVVTNSLCIHYIACHRREIPQEVLDVIMLLEGELEDPTNEQISFH